MRKMDRPKYIWEFWEIVSDTYTDWSEAPLGDPYSIKEATKKAKNLRLLNPKTFQFKIAQLDSWDTGPRGTKYDRVIMYRKKRSEPKTLKRYEDE